MSCDDVKPVMSWPATHTVPSVGREDAAGDRAQGRLAGPGRADERDDLVVVEGEGGVVERDHFFVARGVDLAHGLQAQGRCRVVHDDLPIADAGSTRSTRRSENALPTMAASTSAAALMTSRLVRSW